MAFSFLALIVIGLIVLVVGGGIVLAVIAMGTTRRDK
jgi:hypothetical protein